MAIPSLTATAFALTAGRAADPRAFLTVEQVSLTRTAIVSVEPLDPSPRGVEIAMLGREALVEALWADAGADPSVALGRAFAAANACLVAENRPSTGARWERRSFVGATAVLIDARGVTLAQVPPGQAIVVQDGKSYGFPDLRSWRPDYVPEAPASEPAPLGFGDTLRPSLFRTVTAPGDLIVLCSSSVGRLLARQSRRERDQREEAIASGDPERVLDLLERVVAASDLRDATAAAIAVGGERPAGPRVAIRRPMATLRRGGSEARTPDRPAARGDERSGRAPRERTRPEPRRDAPARPAARPSVRPAARQQVAKSVPVPFLPEPPRVRRVSFRIVLPDSFRLGMLALAEAMMPRRRMAAVPFSTRQQSLVAPGAGSIERFRDPGGLPAEWYANLPRGLEIHLPRPWLAVGLVALLGVSGTRMVVDHHREQARIADSAIVRLDDALSAAAVPQGDRAALVAEAQAAFDAAVAAGAPAGQLASRAADLDAARNAFWGVTPIEGLAPVGAIPAATGDAPRLLASGGAVFVLGDALYQIDPDGRQLVRLLAPGDRVGGRTVGDLVVAGADRDGVLVADGSGAFQRSKIGVWSPAEIGTDGGFDLATLPVGQYDGAFYTVVPDQGIVRVLPEAGEEPMVWASAGQFPDLAEARDVAVDGKVHVLLNDGRVMTFYQHALRTSALPEVTPPLEHPAFLAEAPGSDAVYIVDPATPVGPSTGRIVRVAQDGSAKQYVLPAGSDGAAALAKATGVAVNERTGEVTILAGRDVWHGTIPGFVTVEVPTV